MRARSQRLKSHCLMPHQAAAVADRADPAIALRPMPAVMPRALVVGASTGGPQALSEICAGLGAVVDRAPILIVQHMPAPFTAILAEHLSRAAGRPVCEAEDGVLIRPGRIFVAPGDRHLRVQRGSDGVVAMLDDAAPVHFCKPSVDILFSSSAEVWGKALCGLTLTGMGADGAAGAAAIVQAGGSIIAQDEATSVVWGMPGAVVRSGLCSAVLPLPAIAPALTRLFAGERP